MIRSLLAVGACAAALLAAGSAGAATDVVFVMDSSGSLSNANWVTQRNFVRNVLGQITDPLDAAGVVQFGNTTVNLPIVQLSASNKTQLQDSVAELTHLAQSTYTLAGMNAALTLFNNYGNSGNKRLVFLITDGVPSPATQNPCGTTTNAATFQSNLAAAGVTTFLLTIGADATSTRLKCLTDNNAAGRVLSLATADDLTSTTTAVANIINGQVDGFTGVPEPGTWGIMLLGAGLIGAGLRGRRRRTAVRYA